MTEKEINTLLAELWSYRKTKEISKETLAGQLGMSRNEIHRWDIKKSKPSRLAIEKIQKLIR